MTGPGVVTSLFDPIRLTFNGQYLCVVNQPIDERDDTGSIGKDFTPFRERPIGGDDGGLLFIATVNDFEQKCFKGQALEGLLYIL